MGICNSCESTNVATAKVILQDGRLQEFAYPVRVSQVLEENPSCFICNMDELDFDSFISAINGDEALQPGGLYFALPVCWLKSPLRGETMVSLAEKASLALKKSGGKCRGFGVKKTNVLLDINNIRGFDRSPTTVVGGSRGVAGDRGSMVRGGGRVGRGKDRFITKLNVILEEQRDD